MTKFQLATLLFTSSAKEISIMDSNGTTHHGYVSSVEREDGSGSSFNITLRDGRGGGRCTLHVRTSD